MNILCAVFANVTFTFFSLLNLFFRVNEKNFYLFFFVFVFLIQRVRTDFGRQNSRLFVDKIENVPCRNETYTSQKYTPGNIHAHAPRKSRYRRDLKPCDDVWSPLSHAWWFPACFWHQCLCDLKQQQQQKHSFFKFWIIQYFFFQTPLTDLANFSTLFPLDLEKALQTFKTFFEFQNSVGTLSSGFSWPR